MESNNTNDYKTVLIVGNGFDLNLKMATSYSDFMESGYFKELISDGDNALARYLERKKVSNGNWIDIEIELGRYAKQSSALTSLSTSLFVNNKKDVDEEFRNDFKSLCSALKKYLSEVRGDLKLNRNLNIEDFASYKLIDKVIDEKIPYYVINFNYTIFTDSLINFANRNKEITEHKILQIHGSIEGANIVFGVQDNLDLEQKHSFLYKSHSEFQDVAGLPQILKNAHEIIFFGYSLGETDHSYFEDFFKSQSIHGCDKKRIVFHHYGNEAYDSILWNLKILTNNRLSYLKQHNDVQFIDSKDNP